MVRWCPPDLLLEAIAHQQGVTGTGYIHVRIRDGCFISMDRGMRHTPEELEELFPCEKLKKLVDAGKFDELLGRPSLN